MRGVGLIFLSCCLFIHLGLGKAICKTLRIRFVLFKCVKCLTFWSMITYTLLFTPFQWELCLAISFIASYLSLWVELALNKLARVYEKHY